MVLAPLQVGDVRAGDIFCFATGDVGVGVAPGVASSVHRHYVLLLVATGDVTLLVAPNEFRVLRLSFPVQQYWVYRFLSSFSCGASRDRDTRDEVGIFLSDTYCSVPSVVFAKTIACSAYNKR